MDRESEEKREMPAAADVERTVAQQTKQQPKGEPGKSDKPDEGTRPDDLTSENDGGIEG